MAVDVVCFTVTITGWNIGTGSDISSVTVAGIVCSEIQSQSQHSVEAKIVVAGSGSVGTGDVVVTSAGFSTTLVDGFTFDASSSIDFVEDFDSGLNMFYQADDSVGWYYFDTACPTGTNDVCEDYGPAAGDGMFALVRVDGSGRDAAFESQFSSGLCTDTFTSISVKYYAYSVSSQCFASNFLSIRVQYAEGGAWTTIGSTSSTHSTNSQSWNTLSVSGFSSVLYGVQVLAKTYSPLTNCDFWNPVAIDDISVSYTTQCDCSDTASPTITYSPTGVPTTSSPTPNVTAAGEENSETIFGVSTSLILIAAIGCIIFFVIMCCFCWCDKENARRKARKAERLNQQRVALEMSNAY
jgi:hypothetical protein